MDNSNRLNQKYHGGLKSTQGFEYEIRFSIKKLTEILLPTNSGVKIIKITRQKKEFVDDVVEERSNKTQAFYQCRHYKRWVKSIKSDIKENNLWLDFFEQHKQNSYSDLVLVTQNKDSGFEDLVNLASTAKDEHKLKQELSSDNFHKEALLKFNYLSNLLNVNGSEKFIVNFLKKLKVASYDNFYTKEDAVKELQRFFSVTDAENIYNAFHSKLNSDWLGVAITRTHLIEEIKRLKINTDSIKIEKQPIDTTSVPKHSPSHLLVSSEEFRPKLNYLLRLVNDESLFTKDEITKALNIISTDTTLSWHFLRNLNKPEWFPKIKDNIIKAIVELEEDSAVKFQLLSYFEKCSEKYSDEIAPLLKLLEKNTKNYNILSDLVKTLGKLKPKQKKSVDIIWEIFSKLTEHQHPWVRREISKALDSFVEYDIDKVLEILEKVLFYNPPPQDVTQGSPTLALTFQGNDNENWVFEEAMQTLSKLLNNPKYAEQAIDLAIKVEIEAISRDKEDPETEQRITLDYSYIWLGNKSYESDRLEYNHNRKERIALEIEKALDSYAKSSQKIVYPLIDKLIDAKYEVFFLLTFRILEKHQLKLSANTQNSLQKLDKRLNFKQKVKEPFVITTWSGPRPDVTIEELQKKNDDELVQIMVDSSTGKRAGSWDVAPTYASLVNQNPEKLKDLLPKMQNKKLEPAFAGEMVSAFISKNQTKISDIVNLIPLLSSSDTWARIEIARYLNNICRKAEVQKYDKVPLNKIKEALFMLSKDTNPETDETIKSSNPRPDDAITRGINSVRGITTEAVVAFSHYFPKDEEIVNKIKELANDKTNTIKATLVYNLRYLIGNNYLLCEEVIMKFKNLRDPEIDFALIHFFAQLDCQKFLDKQDFIKSLFNDTNEQINEDLGELIGYRYVSGCEVQDLVDDIRGGRKGTKNSLRSLAFVFESQLVALIGNEKANKVAVYLKKLIGTQNEYEVAERASFVFERDDIKPEHFEFMDKNGLMEELIKNQRNIPAQSHLVNYLRKCIEADIAINRCLQLLHEQVTKNEALLSDHLIAGKVSEIVSLSVNKTLDEEAKEYLLDVFDKGLERGWDEFYKIYFSHKLLNN